MKRPKNRAERRHIADVWRDYRRTLMRLWQADWFNYKGKLIEEGQEWNLGRKQYVAHGNRCGHSMWDRAKHHLEIKKERRVPIEIEEPICEDWTALYLPSNKSCISMWGFITEEDAQHYIESHSCSPNCIGCDCEWAIFPTDDEIRRKFSKI